MRENKHKTLMREVQEGAIDTSTLRKSTWNTETFGASGVVVTQLSRTESEQMGESNKIIVEASKKRRDLAIASGNSLSLLRMLQSSLKHMNLNKVNTDSADLRGTNMRNVSISGSTLINCDLRNAKLSQASLSYTFLMNCNLIGISLREGLSKEIHVGASPITLAFSPDGQFLAAGTSDQLIKIWEFSTNQLVLSLQAHNESLTMIKFSPNGEFIASGSRDNTLKIWEISSGEMVFTTQTYESPVTSLAFSSGGNIVIAGNSDRAVLKIEISKNSVVSKKVSHKYSVNSVSISADDSLVASGSSDKTVKIWEMNNFRSVSRFRRHTGIVETVCFANREDIIASGGYDKKVLVWRARTREVLHSLKYHRDWVTSIVFSSDSEFFVTGGSDKRIYVWSTATGEILKKINTRGSSYSLSLSPDQRNLVYSTNDRIVLDRLPKTMAPIRTHMFTIVSVCISSDNKLIASTSEDRTVKVWDMKTKELLNTFTKQSVGFTHSEFIYHDELIASSAKNGLVYLWEPLTGNIRSKIVISRAKLMSLAFNNDQSVMAVLSVPRKVLSAMSFLNHQPKTENVDDHGTAHVWDMRTLKLVETRLLSSKYCNKVLMSPNGKTIITSTVESLEIWKPLTKRNCKLTTINVPIPHSYGFSKDGKYLGVGMAGGSVSVWAVKDWSFQYSIQVCLHPVVSMDISYNGLYLATGGVDDNITISTLESGRSLFHLFCTTSGKSCIFSQENGTVIIGGDDGTLIIGEFSVVPPESRIMEHW